MMFDNDKLLAVLCQNSYEHNNMRLPGGTQGQVSCIGNTNIIAIRGTEFDFQDILRDMRAMPWWSKELKCFCHSGFLKAAREVVKVAKSIPSPIIFTGHSLGGAIAFLAASILRNTQSLYQYPDISVVTFGEPRSIIGTYKPKHKIHHTRFVNGHDCVPTHPWPIWGYRHQVNAQKIGHARNRFVDHKISNYINVL